MTLKANSFSILEVLRISTVVDKSACSAMRTILEVLRISTVVDQFCNSLFNTFGSTKNFYCCR